MKILNRIGFLLILLTLIVISCREDADFPSGPKTEIVVDPPQINVTSSVYGIVKDQQGEAISDAKVLIDGVAIADTDENGFFQSDLMTLNQYGSNIKVQKSGYFLGSAFVQPVQNRASYTEMVLVQKTLSGTVDATTGGIVTSNGNAKIELPSNGIIDAAGAAYSGSVAVYSYWYDPSTTTTMVEMPGDLRAVNAENDFQQLGTYGMMAVELEDANGNQLQIAEGALATLTMPIPNTMTAGAPSTIPMWYFDEESGYWLEEGSANLANGEYVGTVSHFSFWNCDIPENFIDLSGTVTDVNGNTVDNTLVRLTDSAASYGYTYTDSSGDYSLKVPKNATLTFEIFDYCGDLVFTSTVGPYSVNSTYDPVVPILSTPLVNVIGTLIDCNDMGIIDGYLKIKSEAGSWYGIFPVGPNGEIDINLWDCGQWTDLVFQAFNREDNTISELKSITLVSPVTDFITLKSCDQNPEFLDYMIDGFSFKIVDPRVSTSPNGFMMLDGWDLDSNNVTIFFEEHMNVQNPSYLNVTGESSPGQFISAFCQGCVNVDFEITELGAVGDFVAGDWSGSIPASGGSPEVTVTGSFRAMRE